MQLPLHAGAPGAVAAPRRVPVELGLGRRLGVEDFVADVVEHGKVELGRYERLRQIAHVRDDRVADSQVAGVALRTRGLRGHGSSARGQPLQRYRPTPVGSPRARSVERVVRQVEIAEPAQVPDGCLVIPHRGDAQRVSDLVCRGIGPPPAQVRVVRIDEHDREARLEVFLGVLHIRLEKVNVTVPRPDPPANLSEKLKVLPFGIVYVRKSSRMRRARTFAARSNCARTLSGKSGANLKSTSMSSVPAGPPFHRPRVIPARSPTISIASGPTLRSHPRMTMFPMSDPARASGGIPTWRSMRTVRLDEHDFS